MKHLYLALLLASMAFVSTASAYSVDQAKEDMDSGRYEAVIEQLRQLVDQEQTNYEAWFLFGVAHVHQQQYHQAIEAFRQVISLRPELAEPHNNLAAVYNNLGDTKSAVRELEAALEKRPNYIVAEENLADLYVKLALLHYRNTLQHAPNPIVEQRYARLIQVRNPLADDVAINEDNSVVKPQVIKPEPVKKPVTAIIKQQPKPQKVMATTNPEILEDTSMTGVLDALEAWRLAWANKDVPLYFASYASNYKPESRFGSKKSWQAYKKRVITNKKYIKLSFEQVEITMLPDTQRATAMFLQRFHSNSYNGEDFKKVTFEHGSDGWKIIHEASIK
ncbi:MAG: tetratricopeptide repeat protein [Ghiorsea sp.]